ncbi:hypothetical protein GCM10010306_096270 [Streptomyces umbrinus]|nr:hypothetical protein GCM10010306_096270 [Streptomyces umbrinus]
MSALHRAKERPGAWGRRPISRQTHPRLNHPAPEVGMAPRPGMEADRTEQSDGHTDSRSNVHRVSLHSSTPGPEGRKVR